MIARRPWLGISSANDRVKSETPHVPALRGDTPRQAADGEHRAHLETLLREFEYDHDLGGTRGGPDTVWLRHQLDMPGPDQD